MERGSSFDNLRKRWPTACPRCGEAAPKSRGIINVRLAEAKGNASVGTHLESRQRRFCESCSVYRELLAILNFGSGKEEPAS